MNNIYQVAYKWGFKCYESEDKSNKKRYEQWYQLIEKLIEMKSIDEDELTECMHQFELGLRDAHQLRRK